MEFEQTKIPEVILIKPTVIEDHRGFFIEFYHVLLSIPSGFLQ